MSKRLKAPESYMMAGEPLYAIAAALLQIRDQINIANELIAADPAISHVVATRQIITEMRQQMEGTDIRQQMEGAPEDEEEEEDDAPVFGAPLN